MKFRLTDGERQVFRRLPAVPLSEWAAANLVVKDGPYAGARYRRDVNPYLAGIMDAWSDPEVEEVSVCGSAQTGKTLVLHAALAYSVARRPGPRMLAMQDDDALAKVVANKLVPMLRATRATSKMVAKVRAGRVSFSDGTSLFLASAQSASQRASISIRDLFVDEEALYRQIAGQGVPIDEFLERTRSYAATRKVLRVSKPIGGEECSIAAVLAGGADEVREYEVRCPCCAAYHVMTHDALTVSEGRHSAQDIERGRLARYRCPGCSQLWTDAMRDRAVAAGRWVAVDPVPHPRRIAFHLPAILSSAVSLSEILAAKIRAEGDDSPARRQQYANGYWAVPFRAVELETDEEKILSRREPGLPARTVPGDAVALTAGIDVQKRGFWFCVYAWKDDLSCTLVDYGRLTDWDSVGALIHDTTYPYEKNCPNEGKSLGIWRAGVDSGGTRTDSGVISRTEEVYRFIRANGANRAFACKGASVQSNTPVRAVCLDRMPSSRVHIPGGLWLHLLDTHYFKGLIFARLEEGARHPLTLHGETDKSYALQLCAEALVRDRNGNPRWERRRKDNHYLDCTVMAFACADGSWLPSLSIMIQRARALEAQNAARSARHREDRGARPLRQPSRQSAFAGR